MTTYFAYTRVSTKAQSEYGVSLEEQKRAIEVYAAAHKLEIGAWFEENETAARTGRKVFRTMMCELVQGKAQGLIVHKIDRSARNLSDWAKIGELIDLGIDVRFAHDDLRLSTPAVEGSRRIFKPSSQRITSATFVRKSARDSWAA